MQYGISELYNNVLHGCYLILKGSLVMGERGSALQQIGVLVVFVLLGIYVGLFFVSMQETRDAKKVDTVQISLQKAVSKGMTLLQKSPENINSENILNDADTTFPKGVEVDKHFHMKILHSHREAQFKVLKNGDVVLESLFDFSRFHIENGRIKRNTRWLIP